MFTGTCRAASWSMMQATGHCPNLSAPRGDHRSHPRLCLKAATIPARPTEDLEDLYENAPCGYLSIRPDGRIVKVNLTFATWIGLCRAELIGRRLHDLLNIAGRIFLRNPFRAAAPHAGLLQRSRARPGDAAGQLCRCWSMRRTARRRRPASFTRLTVFNATDRRRYERELVEAQPSPRRREKAAGTQCQGAATSFLPKRPFCWTNARTQRCARSSSRCSAMICATRSAAIEAGMRLLRGTPWNDKAKEHRRDGAGQHGPDGRADRQCDGLRAWPLGGGLSVERNAAESIEPVLRQVSRSCEVAMPGPGDRGPFRPDEPVHCDRRRIGQLASNLLGNALTHGAPDQPVGFRRTTAGRAVRAVRRQCGQAHSPPLLQRIFEPSRAARSVPACRAGAGTLYLARDRQGARRHARCPSTEAETRFTFRCRCAIRSWAGASADGRQH